MTFNSFSHFFEHWLAVTMTFLVLIHSLSWINSPREGTFLPLLRLFNASAYDLVVDLVFMQSLTTKC